MANALISGQDTWLSVTLLFRFLSLASSRPFGPSKGCWTTPLLIARLEARGEEDRASDLVATEMDDEQHLAGYACHDVVHDARLQDEQ